MLALAIAAAADTVSLPGVGDVPLADALATCREGAPRGAVAQADAARVPAFQQVLEALIPTDDRMRTAFFQHHATWPSQPLHATYVPTDTLPWWPRGVAAACHRAGLEMVQRGQALRARCDEGKAACREALGDADPDVLKEALKEIKPEGRVDGLMAAIGAAGVAGFEAPGPLLLRACEVPREAGAAHRFIDRDDLDEARSACLQLLRLVEGRPPELERRVWCDTRWTRDAASPITDLPTDLGATAALRDAQVESLLDHLLRADPEALACDWPAGAAWRRLDTAWREAQQQAACADEALPLPDRAQLCPDLAPRVREACSGGDIAACTLEGQLLAEGVEGPPDLDAALRRWLGPCEAGHAPACDAIAPHADRVSTWLQPAHDRLAAEATARTTEGAEPLPPPEGPDPVDEALALLDAYRGHLDPAWGPAEARRLFDAAVAARRRPLATTLLDGLRDGLEPEALTACEAAVEALPEAPPE